MNNMKDTQELTIIAHKWCNDNKLETRIGAFIGGYNHAATQAVEFAKWIRDNYDFSDNAGMWLNTDEEIAYTTEQLYDIYNKSQGV